MRSWLATHRRGVTAIAAALVAMSVLVGIRGATGPGAGVPAWIGAMTAPMESNPPPSWRRLTSAPLGTSTPAEPATFAFPDPGSWEVRLGAAGSAATALNPPAQAPVQVTSGVDWATGQTLHLTVLDQFAARRLGVHDFLFAISDTPRTEGTGGRSTPGILRRSGTDAPLHTTLSVDYAGFANAFGAGYADRLRVLAVPTCALADPVPSQCRAVPAPLPTANDARAGKLTVDVPDLTALAAPTQADASRTDAGMSLAAADSAVVTFAVTSDTSGSPGTFAASPLSISASWQVLQGPDSSVTRTRSRYPSLAPVPRRRWL